MPLNHFYLLSVIPALCGELRFLALPPENPGQARDDNNPKGGWTTNAVNCLEDESSENEPNYQEEK